MNPVPSLDYSSINAVLDEIVIPKMVPARQHLAEGQTKNVEQSLLASLSAPHIRTRIHSGSRIAIACGSRGIDNLPLIVRTLVSFLKENGAHPFIIPAMGSHGDGKAEGQRELLKIHGITEASCGCPVVSSMETVVAAHTPENEPVYMDKAAYEADSIIPVNRIKPHTDFAGKYESGLMKMMVIGLGKQRGAAQCHRYGFPAMSSRIEMFGREVLSTGKILFGVYTIENSFGKTCRIGALLPQEIPEKEPALLKYAYQMMPRILFDDLHVLVVREIGKEISGCGADPNITRRFSGSLQKGTGTSPEELVYMSLSQETAGNGAGLGLADITTRRLIENLNLESTYLNGITSKGIAACRIPVVMENEKRAVQLAIHNSSCQEIEKLRMVVIQNTESLENIWISPALKEEAMQTGMVELLPHAPALVFYE
jgi:hypothetical protein